ncbi:uncharacterized protein LOC121379900 isoform X2 [Gigantopelta aegis]|nr:uncharacterized protein LOC121379900 isoform X2 [Gigantopelta aegis]
MQIVSIIFILPVWGLLETVELYPRRHTQPQKNWLFRKSLSLEKRRLVARTCSVESKTFQPGEKFVLARTGPCVTYLCRPSGGYTVINQGAHCRDGDTCWSLNSIRTRACSIEMCVQNDDGDTDFVTVQEGCDFHNKCHRVGTTWYHDCNLYMCKIEITHLGIVFKVELLGGRCRDVNGLCHDLGDFFPYKISDTVYGYCSCTFADGQFSYNCLP